MAHTSQRRWLLIVALGVLLVSTSAFDARRLRIKAMKARRKKSEMKRAQDMKREEAPQRRQASSIAAAAAVAAAEGNRLNVERRLAQEGLQQLSETSAVVTQVTEVSEGDACPNACSNHGVCGVSDACDCYPGYIGSDCSQRTCPFHRAFVDTPIGDLNHDGESDSSQKVKVQWSNAPSEAETWPASYTRSDEAHLYRECSGKGVCDRTKGECVCLEGFEGSACQRKLCPNDCSGHGICRTLKEIAQGALNRRRLGSRAGATQFEGVKTAFEYNLWDADKHTSCVCDTGFFGADCSLRECPRGSDPAMAWNAARSCGTKGCVDEVQKVDLPAKATTVYKIGISDSHGKVWYAYPTMSVAEQDALSSSVNAKAFHDAIVKNVPNGAFKRVSVTGQCSGGVGSEGTCSQEFTVSFTRNPGNLEPMTVEALSTASTTATTAQITAAASVTEVTDGTKGEEACSGRGTCDHNTGLCRCFIGYSQDDCSVQNALATVVKSAAVAKSAAVMKSATP